MLKCYQVNSPLISLSLSSNPLPQKRGWALLPGMMPGQPDRGPRGTFLWLAMKHWEQKGGNEPKKEWTHCGAALPAGIETWRQKPLGWGRELRGRITTPNLDPPVLRWPLKVWFSAGGDYLWWTSGEPQAWWLNGGKPAQLLTLLLDAGKQPPISQSYPSSSETDLSWERKIALSESVTLPRLCCLGRKKQL